MESIHLEVSGRVQGVGFRWFVMDNARELRLSGWVRNRPDGNVEIAASGPAEALAQLESAVTSGPPGAQVQKVSRLSQIPGDSLPSPFTIVR
ncbi:MAG TPA: acylphosphatase [Gemmatimonadaceae bacterium]|jgi:acylphosphatase|nr:acylphosphatase [Gemmatimonadaceae bacterium]